MKRYVRGVLGWTRWTKVVGLRADETGRALRAVAPEKQVETTPTGRPMRVFWRNAVPLHEAGTTEDEVLSFWRQQPFDLRLAGKWQGNCDGCFLKSRGHIQRCMLNDPQGMAWWQRIEALVPSA